MTALADDLVREFRAQLEEIAEARDLDAAGRVRHLAELRSDLVRTVLLLDTYLQEAALEGAVSEADAVRTARALADAGYVEHEALDVAAEAGDLAECAQAVIRSITTPGSWDE